MNEVDLKALSVDELKALAFDTILLLERAKQNLNLLQKEIHDRGAEEKPKTEKKGKEK